MTLTKEELSVVMSALDAVVRSGGLNTAKQLLPLAEKIQQMIDETKPE